MNVLLVCLLGTALLATAARLSLSPGGTGIVVSLLVMAAIPIVLADTIAGLSMARVMRGLVGPEAGKLLSLIIVTESLVMGMALFRYLSPGFRTASQTVLAATPSPSLVLSVVGLEMGLFHQATGVDFTVLAWILAFATALALGGLCGVTRRFVPSGRRAEIAIRGIACLFVLGASTPLVLRPPQSQPLSRGVDLGSAVLVPLGLLAVVTLGFLGRSVARISNLGASR